MLWVCVCSLCYPAWNAHAPYCHLWPAWFYNNIPHYLTNGTIFGKHVMDTKYFVWFPLQVLSDTFLILRRNEWDVIKNVYFSSCKIPAIPVRFYWYKFSQQIFEKYSYITFNENPSSGRRVVPWGQTSGRTDGQTDRRIDRDGEAKIAFRNFAIAPRKKGYQYYLWVERVDFWECSLLTVHYFHKISNLSVSLCGNIDVCRQFDSSVWLMSCG
jgi:hypothetical protein